MSEVKSGKFYRNTSNVRTFMLPARKGQEGAFILGPRMTMEAQDEADIKLLGMYHDIVDVATEAPAMAGNFDALRQEVMAERQVSEKLKAENAALLEKLADADPVLVEKLKKDNAEMSARLAKRK